MTQERDRSICEETQEEEKKKQKKKQKISVSD